MTFGPAANAGVLTAMVKIKNVAAKTTPTLFPIRITLHRFDIFHSFFWVVTIGQKSFRIKGFNSDLTSYQNRKVHIFQSYECHPFPLFRPS
jgi:hypothetical protein